MTAHDLALAPARGLAGYLARPTARFLVGYLLLLPAAFLTLFIIVYPIAVAVDLSFPRVRIMSLGAASLPLTAGPIAWRGEPHPAFAVVPVVMIWTPYPFVAIMLLAGLQAIPGTLYEAARVDGASAGQRLAFVTLPSLRPVLAIALVLVVLKIFREFATIFVLTGGGPVRATRNLAVLTYEHAFGFYNIGYAAAVGIVTLIVCGAISTVMVRQSVGAEGRA